MSTQIANLPPHLDVTYELLARELAIDHYPLDEILNRYQISPQRWSTIQRDPRFIKLLESEVANWNSAINTEERTKLKAAAMLEDYLTEAHARLHDAKENLSAKVELVKVIARIAGVGLAGANIDGDKGERFNITINLGADSKLNITGELPPKVIEATPAET